MSISTSECTHLLGLSEARGLRTVLVGKSTGQLLMFRFNKGVC